MASNETAAHIATDARLAAMIRHLDGIYSEAHAELAEKWEAYLLRKDARLRKLWEAFRDAPNRAEKLKAKAAYEKAFRNAVLRDERFRILTENLAERYTHINQDAIAYINGRMPEIYALNYNASGMDISAHVGGYSFQTISAGVVRNMADADTSLLPHKEINPKIDTPWNVRAINGEVSKGILLGESVPDIAKRLRNVTNMDRDSAVRNARTMVTAAENKGRMDEYRAAEEMGIILEREWNAAYDGRTRNLHRELDGQTRATGEPFYVQGYEIMYPGDPSAHPKMVYNCRCTLTARVLGFRNLSTGQNVLTGPYGTAQQHASRDPLTGKTVITNDTSYSQWHERNRRENPEAFEKYLQMIRNESSDRRQYAEYKELLGKNAPKSFDKFREMKYNSDNWDAFLDYTQSVRSGELTSLASFELYRDTSSQIDSELVGLITSEGLAVTGKSKHFIARTIGSVEQRRSGVELSDIREALAAPSAVIPRNSSVQYVLTGKCSVSINPQTGKLIQVNPLHTAKAGEA